MDILFDIFVDHNQFELHFMQKSHLSPFVLHRTYNVRLWNGMRMSIAN